MLAIASAGARRNRLRFGSGGDDETQLEREPWNGWNGLGRSWNRRFILVTLLVCAVPIATANGAAAEDAKAEAAAAQAIEKADNDYANKAPGKALYRLRRALRGCGKGLCSNAIVAALVRDSGSIHVRLHDKKGATKLFARAIALASDLELGPTYDSPDVRGVWEAAGGKKKPEPPPPTPPPPPAHPTNISATTEEVHTPTSTYVAAGTDTSASLRRSRAVSRQVLPAPGPRNERGAAKGVFAPARGFSTSVIDVETSVGAVDRRYSYSNGIAPSPNVFSLFPAPAFGARARLFPLRDLGRPWADIGVAADVSWMVVQASELQGATGTTAPLAYGASIYGRIHPTPSERILLGVSMGYAMRSFGSVGAPEAELPDVHYRAARAAVDGRIAFGRIALTAGVGFRAMVNPSGISTRFYNPSGYGLDGEAGASFAFAKVLELRAAVCYERYQFSFSPPPETFAAGSALDQIVATHLALGFVY